MKPPRPRPAPQGGGNRWGPRRPSGRSFGAPDPRGPAPFRRRPVRPVWGTRAPAELAPRPHESGHGDDAALPPPDPHRLSGIVQAVIRKAGREVPADAALRQQLKQAGRLLPADSRQIARTLFRYYRWQGWLDPDQALGDQIQQAEELADAFALRPQAFPAEQLIERAIPAWSRQHVAVSVDWVRSLQREPRLYLRARPGQAASVAERLPGARPAALADALIFEGDLDLFKTRAFHDGEFEIQDLASQAVGWICHPAPGETWWDACAGEGGKTLHFSHLMQNRGLIWASDRAEWRLRLLKRRAARAEVFNYRTAVWHGDRRLPTKTLFHGVLVDAPCSGLGTWQRNPHARWTLAPHDLTELAALQLQLLTHAAGALKPGGRLVYAVCTLTREETVGVVAAFERACPEVTRQAIVNPLQIGARDAGSPASSGAIGKPGGAAGAPAEPGLWLWPHVHGGNGMFVAAWRR